MRKNIFSYTPGNDPARKDCPVFLPGWGFDGRVAGLADQPRPWLSSTALLDPNDTVTRLAAFLDQSKIDSIVLTGWSMGAYLAIDFALAYPEKVSALYLLAIRRSWPSAEIAQIRTDLGENPVEFMKSFYRKCFLGCRGSARKFYEILQDDYLAALEPERLQGGLDYLESYPLAPRVGALAELNLPVYLLQGARDIITTPAEMADIPGAAVRLIKSAGHPVFLDESCPLDWHLKKESIRRKFSRSAATYDAHATVQREVAERLAAMLPAKAPATVLETGCGTGTYTRLIRARYPEARITSLDFADSMLGLARRKMAGDGAVTFACCDAETFLKESAEQFDLVTSNATMHWFDDLAGTSRLIHQRLTAGGTLACSLFGPGTMGEIREGLESIHGRPVVVPASFFPGQDELREIFEKLFAAVNIAEWQIERVYPSLAALLKHISKTGTAGWHPGRPLLNRHNLANLENWFIDNCGGCRISYQIFMVKCRK